MVGDVKVGGDSQITVQSMLSKPAQDIEANVQQAKELQEAGCQIIRTSVPDIESVKLIYALKNAVTVPIVADIHFDYKIALECATAGVD
ncbi:MAG: 4-hydroxy-3-methylbut-2-en-1-yl diphosphate synthase, partial [Clostridia bacterium]|nr:4-hydroxy-3-methylbut-2-en-1-yl diphosphate synthase [Clostridia bacterium]